MKVTTASTHDKGIEDLDFEMVGIGPARRQGSPGEFDTVISPEEMLQKAELTSDDRDAVDLMRLGKTQVLKVRTKIAEGR